MGGQDAGKLAAGDAPELSTSTSSNTPFTSLVKRFECVNLLVTSVVLRTMRCDTLACKASHCASATCGVDVEPRGGEACASQQAWEGQPGEGGAVPRRWDQRLGKQK